MTCRVWTLSVIDRQAIFLRVLIFHSLDLRPVGLLHFFLSVIFDMLFILSSPCQTLSSPRLYFPHNSFYGIKCHGVKVTGFPQKTRERSYLIERGLEFSAGDAFFREESVTGRDLGVLAASLHKKGNGRLRVLDALCGCGIRSLRYLAEAGADFVAANDGNECYGSTIVENLSRVSSEEEGRWVVTHLEANRVMTDYYLQKNLFDFIDIDSFGSDSSFLRSAISTLKFGGLLYVTSTDGYSSGGHRPHQYESFLFFCSLLYMVNKCLFIYLNVLL